MDDPKSVIYCERQEFDKKWRNLVNMQAYKLLPEIVTGIGAIGFSWRHPKLIVYFSEDTDEESREAAMDQIAIYLDSDS